MEIELKGREKDQIVREIIGAVPSKMTENPSFWNVLSPYIKENDKIIIENNKLYIIKENIQNYDKDDKICTIDQITIELNEKNELVCNNLSGSIIMKHGDNIKVSENLYITHCKYSVYSPDGMEEKREDYSDKFSNPNVVQSPNEALQMLKDTFLNPNGVYRPKISFRSLQEPAFSNNGEHNIMERGNNPNLIAICSIEGIGTSERKSTGFQTYQGLDALGIDVRTSQSYESQYQNKKEKEIMEVSNLIDSLGRIKNGDILHSFEAEQTYNAYINHIIRSYGSMDNFLTYLNDLGLREKYDNVVEQSRKK